jgi:hypothetical protein
MHEVQAAQELPRPPQEELSLHQELGQELHETSRWR